MTNAPHILAAVSYTVCFLGYTGLAIWILLPARQNAFRLALSLAALFMAAQALLHMWVADARLFFASEILRSLAWLMVLAALALPGLRVRSKSPRLAWPIWFLGVLIISEVLQLFIPVFSQSIWVMVHITTLIGALLLIHAIYVYALPSERWAVRMALIGLAGLYAYDLHFYTLFLLEGRMDADLWVARGFVNALIVPLFIFSLKRAPRLRLHPSNQLMLHSITLIIIGFYLLAMALASYGVRMLGGNWGVVLGIAVIFIAAIGGGILLFSGHARAFVRVQLAKHLFAHKYDYRAIWLRFLATISRQEEGYGDLRMRVLQAIAEISESPGALLYAQDCDDNYIVATRWNFTRAAYAKLDGKSPLIATLHDKAMILDFSQMDQPRQVHIRTDLEAWKKQEPHSWLMLPLMHLDRLVAIVLLETPLAARRLDWEDYDLLRTLGRQSASYIAEHDSQVALSEARRFEDFNRRFAFVMHDIKNLVSQLDLLARNAQRHGNNPAFRDDMIQTLQNATAKLSHLLHRLDRQSISKEEEFEIIDLKQIIENLVSQFRARGAQMAFIAKDNLFIRAGQCQLEQMLSHLIQNALEASREGQKVEIILREEKDRSVIDIIDQGCGMSAEFIQSHLFAPFSSTKSKGFGLGAYEAREIIRTLGGQILVRSTVGEGSIFSVYLPLAQREQALLQKQVAS